MSAWKGDARYTRSCDHPPDEFLSDSSEDSPCPATIIRSKAQWKRKYAQELDELFQELKRSGRQLFGDAFLQFAYLGSFAEFVYLHTHP